MEFCWGGFWGWDPVENAGALPWFTATAFLHSVMVQERRGMLRVWNVTLVIVTFFLTIFGTFMTRSGVVQSVHAFGEDKKLATMFTENFKQFEATATPEIKAAGPQGK